MVVSEICLLNEIILPNEIFVIKKSDSLNKSVIISDFFSILPPCVVTPLTKFLRTRVQMAP